MEFTQPKALFAAQLDVEIGVRLECHSQCLYMPLKERKVNTGIDIVDGVWQDDAVLRIKWRGIYDMVNMVNP